MNIEELREYCISKGGVTESFPFDETTLVFKVKNKMFALTDLEGELRINLKCDPEKAIELREKYSWVIPGYHMHKKYWNTVLINEFSNDKLIYEWIDESYYLVKNSLPKKLRNL
ncbi:MAG: MmcQ/YjbR family DNA-binding protein [Bacteroidales bacterium]|nr:MmcQ/YjbR family DNA-binding protein [Bacteroidales bacterium]